MRRITGMILLAALLLGGFVYYRTHIQKIADKDGNPLRYTFEEIEEEEMTGVFVHNEDDTFSPAIKSMPNFQGQTATSSAERFIWYVESDKSMDELIPLVHSGSELVVIYDMDGDLPGSYYLEKYAERGYTIGAHISLDEDKTMYLEAEDALSGSQAAGMLSDMGENTDNIYTVGEISGTDVLPIGNVDPNMNLLLGLERDKLYIFRYYQGTKEREATFKADSKVFQSERFIPISTPYIKTDKGYFIVNLPQNLQSGYYYLSDIGFFEYKR